MTLALYPTSETCDNMQSRLSAAEAHLRQELMDFDPDHPLAVACRELLTVHAEVRELVEQAYNAGSHHADSPANDESHPEIALAAIEIEREAHTLKADLKDVIKALFMWKDDPAERARDKQRA